MKTAVSKSITLRELFSLNGSEMSHKKISTREDSSFNRLEMAVELLKKYSCTSNRLDARCARVSTCNVYDGLNARYARISTVAKCALRAHFAAGWGHLLTQR